MNFIPKTHQKKFKLVNIFSDIYKNKKWGGREKYFFNLRYFSGFGSFNNFVVTKYLKATGCFFNQFQKSFGRKPNVVDLGCGNFVIGSKLRKYASNYTAVDIVSSLIQNNKVKYKYKKVKFLRKNIVKDNLPKADVAIIRMVFQHLTNKEISFVLDKLKKSFKYVIVTDEQPGTTITNEDLDVLKQQVNGGTRHRSNLFISKHPFNFNFRSCKIISNIFASFPTPYSIKESFFTTIIYKLK